MYPCRWRFGSRRSTPALLSFEISTSRRPSRRLQTWSKIGPISAWWRRNQARLTALSPASCELRPKKAFWSKCVLPSWGPDLPVALPRANCAGLALRWCCSVMVVMASASRLGLLPLDGHLDCVGIRAAGWLRHSAISLLFFRPFGNGWLLDREAFGSQCDSAP